MGVRGALWSLVAVVLLVVAVGAAGALAWSGATLRTDGTALARVETQPLAGTVVSVAAHGGDGAAIPLSRHGGLLVPASRLAPGETVAVDVVVRRPGWWAWLVGKTQRIRLTVRTPTAAVADRWLTLERGAPLRLRFDGPVDVVRAGARLLDAGGTHVVSLGAQPPSGSVLVAAAARSWERPGDPVRVSWFPATPRPALLASPGPGSQISPGTRIRLTFARPVGAALPRVTGGAGSWRRLDPHTLAFVPGPLGLPFGGSVRVALPAAASLVDGGAVRTVRALDWTVADGSVLRLHQLLADQGYLPVVWHPAGAPVPHTLPAQYAAAVDPPQGTFTWRYPNTPSQLTTQWKPTQLTQITRGAIMMFEDEHNLAVDGFAGPHVWHTLIDDELAGKRHTGGYSYVYVHTALPQLLTLWHDGSVVLTSPGNTGIPAAPTQPGTYPVFEHIPVGTMSGTNPDGSHYHDTGIQWISYFHGGDALHSFNRASFGTPQSLGCVELPLQAAAKVWPYTPIGTLVTIETP